MNTTTYGYEARKTMATALREATKSAKVDFETAHAAWSLTQTESAWDEREAARARYLALADAQP